MKAMIASDFIQIRRTLASTLVICVMVSVVMVASTASTMAAVATIATTIPYLTVYTLLGNDEVASWAKMRVTMPLTRREIVFGRFAGALLISAVSAVVAVVLTLAIGALLSIGIGYEVERPFGLTMVAGIWGMGAALVLLAIILPLAMKLGFTRGTRILPILFVIVLCAGVALISETDMTPANLSPVSIALVGAAISLIVFAASAAITVKLYESREF